jgi:hypothetical protein
VGPLAPATGSQVAPEPAPHEVRVDDELAALRAELDQARFDSVEARAKTVLAAPAIAARQRNDALELLAIAQIAARADGAAESTLHELFSRDPEHVSHVRDPGPNVAAMFERVRGQTARALSVPLTLSALRDGQGRVIVDVALGVGHDAVDSVHVFARSAQTVAKRVDGPQLDDTSHVVTDVGVRTTLAVALPPAPREASSIALYVEARAPSGTVLGRDGSESAPLIVHLDVRKACADVPLRRRWWVWTSVALAVSGLAIGGALAAH